MRSTGRKTNPPGFDFDRHSRARAHVPLRWTEEDDSTHAINEYGRGKLAGEEAVQEAGGDFYIVRTSWLYGPGRKSFPEKIIERAQADGALRGVTDEIASPTWTGDLAAALLALVSTRRFGLYHLAGEGSCSRKEWAEEVLRLAGIDLPVEAARQAEFQIRCLNCGWVTDALMEYNRNNPPPNNPGGRGKYATERRRSPTRVVPFGNCGDSLP